MHPVKVSARAIVIAKIAAGETGDVTTDDGKTPAAVALGLGGEVIRLDKIPRIKYKRMPCPDERARARGRSNAGTAAERWRRCAIAVCGAEPETFGPVGAVAVAGGTYYPLRRPKPWGPGAPAARHGIGRPCVRCVLLRSHRPSPTAVDRRWTPNEKRRRRLKSLTTGGPTEQASNTARGTPEVPADLRRCWRRPAAPGRKAQSPGTRPGRLGVARCRGPRVRRDPGVPRALTLFQGRLNDQRDGRPGARTNLPGQRSVGLLMRLKN